MAENAELLLKVGLDLAHFRRQLNNVGSQLAGQPLSINIKLDRSKVVSEFRLLDRYIRNKKFYVEVNTNLKAEVERANVLVEKLNEIKRLASSAGGASAQTARGAGLSGNIAAAGYKELRNLYKFAKEAKVPFEQLARGAGSSAAELRRVLAPAFIGVAEDIKKGIETGLADADSKLAKLGGGMGSALLDGIKTTLGIASPSKETGRLGKFAAEGFEKGFISSIVKSERRMARAIQLAVIGGIRNALSNLPGLGGALVSFERQLAASIQLAVRKAVREGMSAAIVPGAKGGLLGGTGGAATGAAIGGAKALGGGIAGGMAKLTAGGLIGTAANLTRYSIDNSAYQEFVGKLYQEIINSALGSGSQGAIIGALAVGGVAGGIGFAKGAAGSLAVQAVTAIRNRVLAALLAVPTGGLNNIVEVMVRDITSAIFQKTIRQLRAANAQLPKIDWPAVTPPSGAAATPRTMALPEGRAFAALPGSTFGAQKRLIGDILDPSLKEILRNAANAFVDAVRQGMTSAVRSVNVRDLGTAARPMLSGGRVAGLLSAGVGRMPSPYATSGAGGGVESRADMIARREREARRRSDLRAMDVLGGGGGRTPSPYSYAYRPTSSAIVPYAPGGAMVPSGRGGGAGGGGGLPPGGGGNFRGIGGPGGGAGGALPTLNLPGSGVIRELGQEFAFATKQVLLFGQAYKLLAFIQDFPGQVGQAVGQLQSFRNTLNAISSSAAEAAKSNQFILDIVDRYNIPIQSARDGFTKLYASMEPAGFRGEEIRGLFESISMGAATFGMSADKVDRVIYAFSQMASKGQVMSEELKGQLGDVLPGAMALFAEAAGFKGPEAITKFSKALEDGVFKGDNMVKLLKSVRVVMEQKFGPGAEGAAKTFQGGINRMQNSLRQLYEAFEPIAVGFMNQVVRPLTDGIRIAADGFNAFFKGVAATTPQGAAFASELERMRPTFEGIGSNLQQLVPTLQLFGQILLAVGKTLAVIAGNPITGFLLKLYANVLLVNTVFNLLGGKILINLISSVSAAIARFIAMNVAVASLQRTATVANSTLAGTQVQMALLTRNAGVAIGPVSALKAALLGLAKIGLIAIAIQVVISGMAEMDRLKQSLNDIAGFSSKAYKKQVQGMSREAVNSAIIVNRRTQQSIQKELQTYKGPVGVARGLVTGRDEELRARLLKVQTQEAVLAGGRGNKRQAEIDRAIFAQSMQPIGDGGGSKGGGKGGGADKAAKAAERAAQERRELNATLEQLREQLRIERQSLETQEAVALARADGNEKLASFLQVQEKYYEIDEKASKLQKDFDAKKIGAAEFTLKQQLLAIERKKVEITEEERLNAVLRERFGITNDVMEAARKARENAFGLNLGGAAGFRTDVNLDPNAKQTRMDEMRQKLDDLVKTENQVYLGAQAIGEAFGTAFKGIASGAMTAQEALAGMMSSIADHFLDMAAQIITQQMTMIIYGTIMKALGLMGGSGGGFGVDFSGAFGAGAGPIPGVGGAFGGGMKLFADGGFVTGPTSAIVGEGGEPEYIIPASKMRSAMSRYATGARGSAVIPAGDDTNAGGGTATMAPTAIDVRYTIERINSVDYVTADQFRAGMAQAAQQGATQGEQRTLRRLQQSRATRSRLGMN